MTLRYAFRSLAKSPGFVAIAVIALGVGLGLSTTMFAVMDAVLHPYVAYKHPETLFGINMWFGKVRPPMTEPELYRYIRDNTHSFAAVVPEERWDQVTLRYSAGEQEVAATRVPPRFFPVTGLTVARGRPFRGGDGEDVAIVSPDLWHRLYGRRESLSGSTVTLGDAVYRIVGVMPEGACGTCVWLPASPGIETNGGTTHGYLIPLARLKPGVSRETAQAELTALARGLSDHFAVQQTPYAFDLTPTVEPSESIQDVQKAMIGSALLVLLIACVNLAHLMLARGLAKQRELSVRMALGASRAAVVRQMLLECAIVTVAGAALGVLITLWGADLLRNRMPQEVSWVGLVRPQLSWRVFALAAGAAAASVALFGLVPAVLIAFRVDVGDPLKDDSGTTTGRVRQRYSPLVVSEVALALVLMMGGGLLLRTLQKLEAEQLNFETRTLYQGFTYWRRAEGDTTRPPAGRRADLLATARGVPGVVDIAMSGGGPVGGGGITAELSNDSTRVIPTLGYESVTSNYISVIGLPILHGRNFEPGDEAGGGVAILDPVAAQLLYGRLNPVGHMIKLAGPAHPGRWIPVIGVVRSPSVLRSRDRDAPQPWILVCERDSDATGRLLIRLRTDDPRIAATLASRLKNSLDLTAYVMPYDYDRRAEIVSRAFLAKVFVGMGAVALGLAALGLYGVLAYAVNRRRREFAVRLALGAEPKTLLKMVLHDGAVMLLAGTGVGAFAALAAARYLDSVLVAVLPSDVIALVLSEAVLLTVGFLAATAPARRAAKANPLDILRAV